MQRERWLKSGAGREFLNRILKPESQPADAERTPDDDPANLA